MQRKLVMADTDECYIRRLSQALRQRTRLTVGIQIITEKELLIEYLHKHEAEWVFLSRELMSEAVRERMGNHLTLLSEEEETDGTSIVLKYQPVDCLVEQILAVLPGRTADVKQEFLAVYPADGGFRSSVFALSMARLLASYGSVLYLNLDCFSPFQALFARTPGSSISDWMFRYRQGVLSARYPEDILSWRGIHLLAPPASPEDCDDLSRLDLAEFLRTVSGIGEFDWVLCQLWERPVQAAELLDMCRILYVPSNGTVWNDMRRQGLFSYLETVYGSDYRQKTAAPELPEPGMDDVTEEEFERVFQTGWRDYVWERLQKDRII